MATRNTRSAQRRQTRRIPGDERKAQLLRVAREIILTQGIAALTMEALADAAEVTKPVVYKHFENSEDVTVAILEDYAATSITYVLSHVHSARDLDEFFEQVIESLFDFIRDNGALSRNITSGFSSTPRIDACFQEMHNRARRIYSHLLEEQGLTVSQSTLAGYALMELINPTVLEFAERNQRSDRETLKAMVRGTLRALLGGAGRKPNIPVHLLGSENSD